MAGSNQWVMGSDVCNELAFIENDEGHAVVKLERINYGLPSTPRCASATDEQWHAIVNDIAMAPEVLAVLREVNYDLDNHSGYLRDSTQALIKETLRRAEPKRKVRVRVTVEVEVESEKAGEELTTAVERVRDRLDCEVVCSQVMG